MKLLILYNQLLSRFIKNHKLLTFIYVLVMSMGIGAFLFLYHTQMEFIEKAKEEPYNHELTLNPMEMSDNLWEFLEKDTRFEKIEFNTKVKSEYAPEQFIYSVIAVLHVQDEALKQENDIFVSSRIYDELKQTQKLTLDNQEYHIIGEIDDPIATVQMSYQHYKKRYKPSSIHVHVKSEFVFSIKSIQEYIENHFNVSVKNKMDQAEKSELEVFKYLLMLASIIILLNILSLYVFMLRSRAKEFLIYDLLGMKKLSILFYLLIETIIFYVISFLIAFIGFVTLNTILGNTLLLKYLWILCMTPLVINLVLVCLVFIVLLRKGGIK
ncbi:hypothetical protein GMA11_06505 [Granulicatella sp. zg-ZJ]|uniref:hypothetical protein n=1 Tax=unclassified Granulicatella TaxID=2630493 RepID=UPI0013C23A8F|nr:MULTISPECIES: hypothetical protein [unclassified Granulicatella]MBS4749858.1 hypothetical protein [Carnobacteriaceae bacterium zg-ZUI78]NEW63044.1 hypothetical protein [Granulicatella sp. zg-ZJ]NEW66203.1 hypothetical protein [Granulicatella sp. zg-84]QMI85952.1 hypothetical protein H1220_00855 [Carnobacteriaceae bacterium zg-84]